MPEITFKVPSVLNGSAGEKKITLDVDSLSDAFGKVCSTMGEDFARRVMEGGAPRSLINIYVNGKNARFTGWMDTELHDGDEVYILPAVAGGSDLSARDLDRYSRQIMLEQIGYAGQQRLQGSRACVVGAGGLGSPIISRLVAMGVGTVRIVDRDVVELSNLHRQTIYEESDVGEVKVEAAARHLRRKNSDVTIEALPVSVNRHTAREVTENCDVVIDALDSVNARYALNTACVEKGIPFVTGAAVGVSGQVFTILPGTTACYHCMFPSLDEDSMPTCSIDGVHPPILSIVGGIEVAEAVKVLLGQRPGLSDRILHIDLEGLGFSFTRTGMVPECPVCGSGVLQQEQNREMIIEELCGRAGGKRTFSLTPARTFDLDVSYMTEAAARRGFRVENQGDLGVSVRTDECSVSFMKHGSAVVVGTKSESEAVELYNDLLGRATKPAAS